MENLRLNAELIFTFGIEFVTIRRLSRMSLNRWNTTAFWPEPSFFKCKYILEIGGSAEQMLGCW